MWRSTGVGFRANTSPVTVPGETRTDTSGFRVDDVMNVAGYRISTMEVESALVDHQSVAEAAVGRQTA